jgi:toxin ParE1/3/4
MRVRWTRRSVKALDAIAEYIAQDRPQAALRMVVRIEEAVASLARYPELGRSGRVPGTRELIVAGTPYIVAYRIDKSSVEILTVLHSARQWPDRF